MQAHLQNLIAQGRTEDALAALQQSDRWDARDRNMVIQLAGRYAQNEHRRHLGDISVEHYQLERNRIHEALLVVIGRITDGAAEANGPNPPPPPPPTIVQQAEKIYNIGHIDKADFN